MSSDNSAPENHNLISEQNGGGSSTTESQTTTTKFSSLGLLLPNRPKPLCKGRSFVNLPPPSRIENGLLFVYSFKIMCFILFCLRAEIAKFTIPSKFQSNLNLPSALSLHSFPVNYLLFIQA